MAGVDDRKRLVVEISRRGKLISGEPYFTPGTPIVLDAKGFGRARARRPRGRPAGPGTSARRAADRKLEADRERARGAARRAGRPRRVRAVRPACAETLDGRVDLRDLPTITIDPDDGEGLRRRALVPPRARRDPGVGAHRRRLLVRSRRNAARPGRRRACVLDVRARATSRRCCRRLSRTRPARYAPLQDRLTVTVEMPPSGEPLFYRSVIRSRARLTYGQAQRRDASPEVLEQLDLATEIATALRAARFARGALEVSSTEIEFSFADGRVERAWRQGEPQAHMLVEELMIRANEHVAEFLSSRRRQALYRVHERPEPQSVSRLLSPACRPGGADAAGAGAHLAAGGRRALAGAISRRVTEYVEQSGRGREAFPTLVLRALKQARYDPREPRPLGSREPCVLPLHLADPPLPRPGRPSGASRTSSGSARTRRPTTSAGSRSTPRPRSGRQGRSSTSQTTSASRGSSRTSCTTAAGMRAGRARSPARSARGSSSASARSSRGCSPRGGSTASSTS